MEQRHTLHRLLTTDDISFFSVIYINNFLKIQQNIEECPSLLNKVVLPTDDNNVIRDSIHNCFLSININNFINNNSIDQQLSMSDKIKNIKNATINDPNFNKENIKKCIESQLDLFDISSIVFNNDINNDIWKKFDKEFKDKNDIYTPAFNIFIDEINSIIDSNVNDTIKYIQIGRLSTTFKCGLNNNNARLIKYINNYVKNIIDNKSKLLLYLDELLKYIINQIKNCDSNMVGSVVLKDVESIIHDSEKLNIYFNNDVNKLRIFVKDVREQFMSYDNFKKNKYVSYLELSYTIDSVKNPYFYINNKELIKSANSAITSVSNHIESTALSSSHNYIPVLTASIVSSVVGPLFAFVVGAVANKLTTSIVESEFYQNTASMADHNKVFMEYINKSNYKNVRGSPCSYTMNGKNIDEYIQKFLVSSYLLSEYQKTSYEYYDKFIKRLMFYLFIYDDSCTSKNIISNVNSPKIDEEQFRELINIIYDCTNDKEVIYFLKYIDSIKKNDILDIIKNHFTVIEYEYIKSFKKKDDTCDFVQITSLTNIIKGYFDELFILEPSVSELFLKFITNINDPVISPIKPSVVGNSTNIVQQSDMSDYKLIEQQNPILPSSLLEDYTKPAPREIKPRGVKKAQDNNITSGGNKFSKKNKINTKNKKTKKTKINKKTKKNKK
jgi:hypothetical protein